MSLDADQLSAFFSVATTGSFRGAALALHLTQPAISQRVRSLEEALKQRVFLRTGRGVELTPPGVVLLRYCHRQRELEGAALAEPLKGATGRLAGPLRITCASAEVGWVLPLLSQIARANPDVDVSLERDDRVDAVRKLERGEVDMALSDRAVRRPGIRARRIGATSYGLVASPDCSRGWSDAPRLKELRSARTVDFDENDTTTLDLLTLALPGADLSGVARHFIGDTQGIIEWVLLGGGVSALPLRAVESHVSSGALRRLFPGVESGRHIYVCVMDGAESAACRALETALTRALAISSIDA